MKYKDMWEELKDDIYGTTGYVNRPMILGMITEIEQKEKDRVIKETTSIVTCDRCMLVGTKVCETCPRRIK